MTTTPDTMDNTVKSIFSMACPTCGSDEDLLVDITTLAYLSADGTEATGDHDWDDDSGCRCSACDHTGQVKDFRINSGKNTNA
jgi:hypothetical protein